MSTISPQSLSGSSQSGCPEEINIFEISIKSGIAYNLILKIPFPSLLHYRFMNMKSICIIYDNLTQIAAIVRMSDFSKFLIALFLYSPFSS